MDLPCVLLLRTSGSPAAGRSHPDRSARPPLEPTPRLGRRGVRRGARGAAHPRSRGRCVRRGAAQGGGAEEIARRAASATRGGAPAAGVTAAAPSATPGCPAAAQDAARMRRESSSTSLVPHALAALLLEFHHVLDLQLGLRKRALRRQAERPVASAALSSMSSRARAPNS
ncbi:unnamed protein product, partial [Prorocentrum cordatum]